MKSVAKRAAAFAAVEPFLDGLVRREALAAALAAGIIGRLEMGAQAPAELIQSLRLNPVQAALLFDVLAGHRVLAVAKKRLVLAPQFKRALKYRDLLETQLDFTRHVSDRLAAHYAAALVLPSKAGTAYGDYFTYDRGPPTAESKLRAARWVRLMSTLTRYQAPLLLERIDLSPCRELIDVGGNIGELAVQLCQAYPGLSATVVDLPTVCALGEDHAQSHGLSARVRFAPGDATRGPLPGPADVVVFKSFLHDWDEANALRMLSFAWDALRPGGQLLIFEMHAPQLRRAPFPEHQIAYLPFLNCFRAPNFYVAPLQAIGFSQVRVRSVPSIDFSLTTAKKNR